MELDLKTTNWQTVHMRPVTKQLVQKISHGRYNPKIRYVVLFGSEARGAATLTSDVDIALISDEPLTRAERLQFEEIFDEVVFPKVRVINTLIADLNVDNFMNVNHHIKREGLIIYER